MLRNTLSGVLVAFVAVFLFANTALATNVGVFNMMIITNDSDIAKEAEKQLKASFGKDGDALDSEAQALQKRFSDFQTQAAALSEKARNERAQELDKAGRAFEEKRMAFTQKVGVIQQSMQTELLEIVQQACETYAKSKKLDLILDGSASVAFAASSVDITKGVIDEMNKIWKARGSKFKK